ncbi:MAG: LysR family transcriptional regulator [Lachnospiraceae bacterium]|nr:LysR family transcriptional regulator [Lachnospiraceae bacterium]
MEIRNLITFTKVAEAQSLSKAARLLGYAQSTVTMQMQQLEQELGVPLYERVGKQIRITQAGQELLAYAVPIIKMSQEALRIGKGATREIDGLLRLGVLETLLNPRLEERLDQYLIRHPKVELKVITEADDRVLLDRLRHNEIDFLITLDHLRKEPDLVHAEDVEDAVHFYAAPGHPLEQQSELNLQEILQYPLIRGNESLAYEQQLEHQIQQLGLEQTDHQQMVLQNQDMALRMAARQHGRGAQSGIVLAPESAVREYQENGQLEQLNYQFPEGRMWQQTIYHKNKWLTGAMNAWIDMAEDRR